jgi:hypothetical protein
MQVPPQPALPAEPTAAAREATEPSALQLMAM